MAVEREEREEIDASSSEDGDVPHTKVFEMPFVVRRARTSREAIIGTGERDRRATASRRSTWPARSPGSIPIDLS